jgi:hypothetical protein
MLVAREQLARGPHSVVVLCAVGDEPETQQPLVLKVTRLSRAATAAADRTVAAWLAPARLTCAAHLSCPARLTCAARRPAGRGCGCGSGRASRLQRGGACAARAPAEWPRPRPLRHRIPRLARKPGTASGPAAPRVPAWWRPRLAAREAGAARTAGKAATLRAQTATLRAQAATHVPRLQPFVCRLHSPVCRLQPHVPRLQPYVCRRRASMRGAQRWGSRRRTLTLPLPLPLPLTPTPDPDLKPCSSPCLSPSPNPNPTPRRCTGRVWCTAISSPRTCALTKQATPSWSTWVMHAS